MSNLKRYLVMVDSDRRENLSAVAQRLQAAGCQIEQMMDGLGIIGVSVEDDKINELQQIEGVKEITSGEDRFWAI